MPSPPQLSMWFTLILVFDRKIWLTLLLSMILLLFTIRLIVSVNHARSQRKEHMHYQTLQGSMLSIVSVLVGKDFLKAPRMSYLRAIIMMWALCAMVLYTLHASNLARNSIQPQREKRIQLETLADTDLVFGSILYSQPFIKVFYETTEKLRNKPIKTYDCKNMWACFSMLREHR